MENLPMSNEQIWLHVEDFISSHKSGIYTMHNRYGWISGRQYEDSVNDMRYICFEVIRDLEKKYGNDFNFSDPKFSKMVSKLTYGRFRVRNWNERLERHIRKSDILNVAPSSDADSCLYYDDPDIESYTVSTFNDDEPDAGDYYEADIEAEKILDKLCDILPKNCKNMINYSLLHGSEHGKLNHNEIADALGLDRSTVTKYINESRNKLIRFCQINGLSLNMPRQELLDRLTDLVAGYRASMRMGNENIGVKGLTVADFLKDQSDIMPEDKDDYADIDGSMEEPCFADDFKKLNHTI